MAKEREAIDEKVKQQVAQALQEQLSTFTQQMTVMFAQMMTTQQNDHNSGKRSAIHIQNVCIESEEDQERVRRDDLTKRRDNKKTPTKTPTKEQTIASETWNTPDYLEEIASQSEWTKSPPSKSAGGSEMSTLNEEGDNNQMSESEDEDIIKQGSGTESTNKSLANILELEALQGKND